MLKIPTKILPKRMLDRVKRSRPIYDVARRSRFAVGELLGARTVRGLGGRVHYNDFMLASADPTDVENYRRGAAEFVDILQRSCREAGRDWTSIDAVLEVGCGYGRIVRELTTRIAPSKVFVSDVIDAGARFTAAEFHVQKVPPMETAGRTLADRFDLIYLLSVYTHLRRDMVVANLIRIADGLRPGAVAVVTIHGEVSARTAERYGQYWLDKDRVAAALSREGYYYERYPYYYAEYGLTWFTPAAFKALVAEAAPRLASVAFHPADIDGHQDVFVFRKG